MARDILRDGPSPELAALWVEWEAAELLYPKLSAEGKAELLAKFPEIRDEVICSECGREKC